jgi:hypothetical protein
MNFKVQCLFILFQRIHANTIQRPLSRSYSLLTKSQTSANMFKDTKGANKSRKLNINRHYNKQMKNKIKHKQ